MLSVVVAVRNSRQSAVNCLDALGRTFAALGPGGAGPGGAEFVFIDDGSDAPCGIPGLFTSFRAAFSGAPVQIVRFPRRRYYTYALAVGLSLARGDQVLFVSHDMMATPDYVRAMTRAAAADPTLGVVRGTSGHVDGFPQHVYHPPFPTRTYDDVLAFSAYAARYWGDAVVEDDLLIGDSFLVTRAALDRVGVFDTGYHWFFGDLDFGLRVQRAGLRLGCAKGAWLYHEGAGHRRDELVTTGKPEIVLHAAETQIVQAAYARFRDKWGGAGMPAAYPGFRAIPFAALRDATPFGPADYQPPAAPGPDEAEVL